MSTEPLDTVSSPEEKEQAAAQGWREEPREGFKTAKEFLEFGDKVAPIIRERRDHFAAQIAELKMENQGMKEAFFKSQHDAKMEGYKKAKAELLEKQATAFENADQAGFERTKAALEKLEPPEPITVPIRTAVPPVDHDFIAFQQENASWVNNKIMGAAAMEIAREIQLTTDLVGKPFYDEVAKRVKEEFPHKFGNQNRRAPSAAESGGGTPQAKTGKKDYASLPADIKAGVEHAMKAFGYKTKEDYATAYWREADKNGWA